MYKHPRELLELLFNLPYPFIIIGTALVTAAVMAIPLGVRPPKRGVFVNALGLSNTVVMGMPVTLSLLGERALPVVMIYYACNTMTYWTVGIWLMRREVPGRPARGIAASLWEAVTTPPFMGFLIGVLWVLTTLPVPGFLAKTMEMIGNSVTLMCMVFIGSVIRFSDFRNVRKERTLRILLPYKYLLSPALAAFLCWLLPLPLFMKQVFFIQANMPAMAQLPIMAKEVGADYEFASLVTAITTSVSMATVPFYIFLMEYSGIFA
jgi:predicted permease